MRIGVYYATTSGNTEVITEQIIEFLGKETVTANDIEETGFAGYDEYDILLFGAPTWDYGHLQSDWDACWSEFKSLDLTGKYVGLYGLGDQYGYPEWYLDAMGMIHDIAVENGAVILGHWVNTGYNFEKSKALTKDESHFVGLALDEESQPLETPKRIQQWCLSILEEYKHALEETCLP